jgi:hypothetical protein
LQKTDWQLTMMSDCEVRTIQMAIWKRDNEGHLITVGVNGNARECQPVMSREITRLWTGESNSAPLSVSVTLSNGLRVGRRWSDRDFKRLRLHQRQNSLRKDPWERLSF